MTAQAFFRFVGSSPVTRRSSLALCLSKRRSVAVLQAVAIPMHVCRATRAHFASANTPFHAARRSAPLATQAVKVVDQGGRGNPCAVLRPAPGLREQQTR